jgi:hypothetical protein
MRLSSQRKTASPDVYPPSREQDWIVLNGPQYKGEWVALDGDRLLCHGPDALYVYNYARAQGILSPFVVRIPSGEELPWGGW